MTASGHQRLCRAGRHSWAIAAAGRCGDLQVDVVVLHRGAPAQAAPLGELVGSAARRRAGHLAGRLLPRVADERGGGQQRAQLVRAMMPMVARVQRASRAAGSRRRPSIRTRRRPAPRWRCWPPATRRACLNARWLAIRQRGASEENRRWNSGDASVGQVEARCHRLSRHAGEPGTSGVRHTSS